MILIGRGLDLEEEIWKREVSRELVQGQEPVKRGRKPERLCSFEGVEAEGREAESERKRKRRPERFLKRTQPNTISGDNSLRVPPVPIPNTVVKPQYAESTWRETAWKHRSLPVPTKRGSILSFSFFPEFEKRRLPFGCPLPFFLPPSSSSSKGP